LSWITLYVTSDIRKSGKTWFTIHPRKSCRHQKVALTDYHFADDISHLSDEIEQAQKLLSCVERECKKVGLIINAKKTKCMSINIENPPSLYTTNGTVLEQAGDFKYLGSWLEQIERERYCCMEISSMAGSQWHVSIWMSSLNSELKEG
jgi:hypothetical protein